MHRPTRAVVLIVLALAGCSAPDGAPTESASSPTPTESVAAAPPSEAPSPSPSPSPSASAVEEPTVPEVELGYGARLEIGQPADVREMPGSAATAVASLDAGDEVAVDYAGAGPEGAGPMFGPIEADGLTWYPIAAPKPDSWTGWLAIEEADATVVQPECPEADAPTVSEIVDLSPQERLACFGDRPLSLQGPVGLSCLGGMAFGTWEPMWLAWPFTTFIRGDTQADTLKVRPAEGLEMPEKPADSTDCDAPARVTVHFDDPASSACEVRAPAAAAPELASEVELYCRTQAVITEIVLGDG
jgi:hypothetical protein